MMPKNAQLGAQRQPALSTIVTVGDRKRGYFLDQRALKVASKKAWSGIPGLVKTMLKVLREAGGQAISANQIGSPLAVVVIETRKTKARPRVPTLCLVMINPHIVKRSKKKVSAWEGCLSVMAPKGNHLLQAKVVRCQSVTVEFLDLGGRRLRRKFKGLLARIVQHEVDHLKGKIFLQRVTWSGCMAKRLRIARR